MKDNKQRLFEVMGKLDNSFKPKLNENYNNDEVFTPQGSYTVSNSGGYEIMLNNSGDAAKVRDAFGSNDPKTSDWLEIEYVPDEETGESEPVIDPNGYNIPLSQVMKINQQNVEEEFQPDYSNGEYFQDKLEELFTQMEQSGYDKEAMMSMVEKALPLHDVSEDANSQSNSFSLTKGFGYWDVSKYPYGGDFKRFNGTETGQLIKGTVKKGDEVRMKLDDGREIVTLARAINGMEFDDILRAADAIGRVIV